MNLEHLRIRLSLVIIERVAKSIKEISFLYMVIFRGQFCPRRKGAMRLALCETPTCETRPDYNTGNNVP